MGKHVTVDDRALTRYFLGLYKRNTNYRPVFRWARSELASANRRNFATRGGVSGSPWPGLDEEYARWKLSEYGPRPVLVATGALFRSLAFLRGHPNHLGRKDATFGTDIPYAKWHQKGTRSMPMRKVVFVPRTFAYRLAKKTGTYLVHGEGAGRAWRALKGLFQS